MAGYKQLDEQWLERNLPGGRGFVVELLELFVAQGREGLQVFNAAQASAQLIGVREQAHKIKGSAAALGLHQVTTCMAELEKAIREGKDFAAVSENLQKCMETLQDTLRESEVYMKKNI